MADNTIDGWHTTNVPGDYGPHPTIPEPVYTLYPDGKRLAFLDADNPNSGTGISYYSAGAQTTGKAYVELLFNSISSPGTSGFGLMGHNAGPEALEFTTFPRAGSHTYKLSFSGGFRVGDFFSYVDEDDDGPFESYSGSASWGGTNWTAGTRFGIAVDMDAKTIRLFNNDVEFVVPEFAWDIDVPMRIFVSGREGFDVTMLSTGADLADSATMQALAAEGYTPWVYEPPIPCCPPLPQREEGDCGDTSCGRAFKKVDVSWSDTVKLDGEYVFPESRLYPVETVRTTVPIGRESRGYRLTLGSVLWSPLTVAGLEWTGQYFNNTRRTG
jgi:hypothetical protein